MEQWQNHSMGLARRTRRDLTIATLAMALFAAHPQSRVQGQVDIGIGGGNGDVSPISPTTGPATAPAGSAAAKKAADDADVDSLMKTVEGVGIAKKKVAAGAKGAVWPQMTDPQLFVNRPAARGEALLNCGQYEDAAEVFDEALAAATTPKQKERAILGKALTVAINPLSKLEEVEKVIADLPAGLRDDARLVTAHADVLVRSGKMPEAVKLLKEYVKGHAFAAPPMFDAGLIGAYNAYAGLLERTGDYAAATNVYSAIGSLATTPVPAEANDSAAIKTQIALGLLGEGRLTGQGMSRQKDILSRLEDATKDDHSYWPAELAIAKLQVANHDGDGAKESFATVQAINPNVLDVFLSGAESAINGLLFPQAIATLEATQKVGHSPQVAALTGRMLIAQRAPEKALQVLRVALQEDPYDPRTRGWAAGALLLLNQPERAQKQLDAIKTPAGGVHPVVAYEAGEVLRAERQFKAAEKLYLEAAAGAPFWCDPYTALASLYLEVGDLESAKKAYDEAFKIDPTNMTAFNQLQLLDILAHFKTKKTAHFLIRYAEDRDAVLADLISDWMENHVYPEVCGYFNYYPEVVTTIELYPTHEQFGVRTTGLPWIGTVGASTGNVIAMDIPRVDAATSGPFDWARVLRHEFTHTVTLGLTGNRIPHWLTEAAACAQELAPRSWEAIELMDGAYRTQSLFPVATINWAFVIPQRPNDRAAAYAESHLIYDYLVQTYGLPKMMEFLGAFKDGARQADALHTVYNLSEAELDQRFSEWLGGQLKSWGMPTDRVYSVKQAQAALDANRNSTAAKLDLGEAYLAAGKANLAKKNLDEVLAVEPKNARAREALGTALLGKKPAEAAVVFEGLLRDEPENATALRELGNQAMGQRDYARAEALFLKLQQVSPVETTSYENLAGIYLVNKQFDKATAQLLELQKNEQHDDRIARRLAELFIKSGDMEQAATFAYKAIRINPYNAINHKILASVYGLEKKPAEALPYWQHATELAPTVAVYWAGLAASQADTGDAAGAKMSAQKAVDLDPKSAAGKYLQ